jgi:hypothetical protein
MVGSYRDPACCVIQHQNLQMKEAWPSLKTQEQNRRAKRSSCFGSVAVGTKQEGNSRYISWCGGVLSRYLVLLRTPLRACVLGDK